MSLTLTVLSFKSQPISGIKAVSIGSEGGSIGRSDDNTLTLPDTEKLVSRHHASIKAENGAYYLTDTSLSGVYFNGEENALHNATKRLDNGMVLRISEYEIAVAITAAMQNTAVEDDFPFPLFDPITPKPTTSAPTWIEEGLWGENPLIQGNNESSSHGFNPMSQSTGFSSVDEPWVESKNPLFQDDLSPSHGTLVQMESEIYTPDFESGLQGGNQSPLSNSYIAPSVSSSSATSSSTAIPENFSFDDLWNEQPATNQVVNTPIVNDDFDDFLGAAISRLGTETEQPSLTTEIPIAHSHDAIEPVELPISNDTLIEPVLHSSFTEFNATSLFDEIETPTEINPDSNSFGLFADNDTPIDLPNITTVVNEPLTENIHEVGVVEWAADERSPSFEINPPFSSPVSPPAFTAPETNARNEDNKINLEPPVLVNEKTHTAPIADSVLFDAFLQGVNIECKKIQPEQQTETLHRVGQMFRKLIDGTVAVLRSRAEFKSLFRLYDMTTMGADNNSPLKFIFSSDDMLQQLLENKNHGFLSPTAAIEEAFNDIMNHQLAMQAGIQASLTDLLQTLDPKIIEKQFEQGLVLQKKTKCWESYEKTYRNTVEDAVEKFYGEAFAEAYDKQMNLLTKSRKK